MIHWMDQPLKSLGRLTWNQSVLSSHPLARPVELAREPFLESIKKKFKPKPRPRSVPLDTARPRLVHPRSIAIGSYQPQRYFCRGALETDRKKNPTPIWYLLTESLEQPIARPVPHNTSLIRSLCKGRGRLRQNKEGLIYLDVHNQFILAMTPYLKAEGLVRPPYFSIFSTPEGAHIPVIPKREADFHYLDECKEIDREFSFEIEGLYSMKPDSWQEVEEVWFFKVKSPELEALRRRYFLTALPGGHDFHIAVAVKPRPKGMPARQAVPFMRINPSFNAA